MTSPALDWLTEPDPDKIAARLRNDAQWDRDLRNDLDRFTDPRWAALDRWLATTTHPERVEMLREAWADHPELAADTGDEGWLKLASEVERPSFRSLLRRRGALTGLASAKQVRFVVWLLVPLLVVGIIVQSYDNELVLHLSRWVCTIAGVIGLVYIGPSVLAEHRAEVVSRAVTAATSPPR